MTKQTIYTIPSGFSFVDVLAKGIMKFTQDDPLALAHIQILLPTRRACRTLKEAFLKLSGGHPLLLPRMHPIGDVDEEELSLFIGAQLSQEDINLPPAISSLQRQLLLTKLIAAQDKGRGIAQDIELAKALAILMDQTYTEDLDLKDLPRLVDEAEFADHWQISIKFLSILSNNWPNILKAHGMLDGADRRNQLLKKLADYWQKNPPQHKIIAAGSTGSIPATGILLKTISDLPHGMVVLPGLDQNMDDESWNKLDDSHPQATLKNLLGIMNIARAKVGLWDECLNDINQKEHIRNFTSEIMRPPETTHQWQTIKDRVHCNIKDFLIERYDCAGPQEEAHVIALALRRSLEDKTKTAALVTPDRKLARRVSVACQQWGIEIDDSAGQSLASTKPATYLRLLIETIVSDLKPVSLLDFCKHTLCAPAAAGQWRGDIRLIEKNLFRGALFQGGAEGYLKKLNALDDDAKIYPHKEKIAKECRRIFGFLYERLKPLADLTLNEGLHPFTVWMNTHIATAEEFCPKEILWAGQEGEAITKFLLEISTHANLLPEMNAAEYLTVLTSFIKPISVRPKFGLHPRLMILGQLEARLLEADVMILSGLNEGTWPQKPSSDPWMSRPMRKNFGLPSIERSTGLSAHDFAQSLCANEVVLTRSTRVDGTPTVPSRWLQRMEAVIEALGYEKNIFSNHKELRAITQKQNEPNGELLAVKRPEPAPPVEVRPRELPVTKIEYWINDPYSIYARYILKLKPLDDLEQDLDAAIRGNIIHTILNDFYTKHAQSAPNNFMDEFMAIATDALNDAGIENHTRILWIPRLKKVAAWLEQEDKTMRASFTPYILEQRGELTLKNSGEDFKITCRADRIDISKDGNEAAIIDYKSGGKYTTKRIQNGELPQLSLEALILKDGLFDGKKKLLSSMLSYWVVSGGKDGGEKNELLGVDNISKAMEYAHEGLIRLIEKFDILETPYYSLPRPEKAPRFNDYEHLARVKEWTALDDFESADEENAA